jgi:O-antigen/teichoic acid export membrane protein
VVFGRGITRIAQFATFVILARFLSPSEFGWYGLITTAVALAASIGTLGLRQSFAYWIGQNRLSTGSAIGTALVVWPVLAITSIAIILALYGSSAPIAKAVLSWTISITVAGALLISLLQGTSLGRGQMGAFTVGENLPRTALMVGVLVMLLGGHVTIESALWAQAAGFAITLPVVLWFALRGTGRLGVRFRPLPAMVGYGGIFAINLFLLMLGARLSMFILEATHGAAEAGRFFAAVRVNEILLEVAAALGMVLFSSAARTDKPTSSVARSARMSCWMFWAFGLLAIVVAPLAPLLLQLLAGSAYASAGAALQVMALGLAPAAACKLIYPTLAGSGRPYFGTPAIVASLAVNLLVALLAVPAWGLVGGAVALVSGQFTLWAIYVLACNRQYQVPIRDFLLPRGTDVRAIKNAAGKRIRHIFRWFKR